MDNFDNDFLDSSGNQLLSSRRRIYPDILYEDTDREEMDDNDNEGDREKNRNRILLEGQREMEMERRSEKESRKKIAQTKKASDPKFSFRKYEAVMTSTSTPRPFQGMKEKVMLRPAIGTKSPIDEMAEKEQLRQLHGF